MDTGQTKGAVSLMDFLKARPTWQLIVGCWVLFGLWVALGFATYGVSILLTGAGAFIWLISMIAACFIKEWQGHGPWWTH